MTARRKVSLVDLAEVVAETRSLLEIGYSMSGQWTLGQICCHMRTTIQANMDGYPKWMVIVGYPLRPILRWLALPRLLNGGAPQGIKTAGMFVPPANLDDEDEVEKLEQCVSLFLSSKKPLHAHPGFGSMDRVAFEKFHSAHAAHHLGFLVPTIQAAS